MRFNAFREAIAESVWFDFPYQDGIRFKIRRAGYPPFAKRSLDTNQKRWLEAFVAAADKKGLTLNDLRSGDVDFERLAGEISLGELGLAELGVLGLDVEGVANELVEEVEGPLILEDDSDTVIPWHQDNAGAGLLEAYPEVGRWIQEKAREVEATYQAMMEASAKNSPNSSAPVAEGEEVNA